LGTFQPTADGREALIQKASKSYDSGEIWIAQNTEANIRIIREISMEAKTFLEGKKNPAQNGKPQAHAALAIQVLPMQL
jgi:phosphopantetheine adenylyltransferase